MADLAIHPTLRRAPVAVVVERDFTGLPRWRSTIVVRLQSWRAPDRVLRKFRDDQRDEANAYAADAARQIPFAEVETL